MKNLVIITFILFLTDLNHSVNSEEKRLAVKNQIERSIRLKRSANITTEASQSSTLNSKMLTENVFYEKGLKVKSVIKAMSSNLTIVSDEHLSNESSITKEISKNLLNQDLISKQPKEDKQLKKSTNQLNVTSTQLNASTKLSTANATTTQPPKTIDECSKTQFDYLALRLSWPVNICSKRACILNSPQRWFIHNLSPLFHLQDKQLSQCCGKRPFNTSELGSITNELKVSFFRIR